MSIHPVSQDLPVLTSAPLLAAAEAVDSLQQKTDELVQRHLATLGALHDGKDEAAETPLATPAPAVAAERAAPLLGKRPRPLSVLVPQSDTDSEAAEESPVVAPKTPKTVELTVHGTHLKRFPWDEKANELQNTFPALNVYFESFGKRRKVTPVNMSEYIHLKFRRFQEPRLILGEQ